MSETVLTRAGMRARIEAYYADCNLGDAARIARHFTVDAIHYFPETDRYGAFRSALGIGQAWAETVKHTGARWTVDHFIGDPDQGEAVAEWTQFRPKQGKRLRGDEWYRFDPRTGLITEVRAYFAATEHGGQKVHELGEFDYAGRGYALEPPKA